MVQENHAKRFTEPLEMLVEFYEYFVNAPTFKHRIVFFRCRNVTQCDR